MELNDYSPEQIAAFSAYAVTPEVRKVLDEYMFQLLVRPLTPAIEFVPTTISPRPGKYYQTRIVHPTFAHGLPTAK